MLRHHQRRASRTLRAGARFTTINIGRQTARERRITRTRSSRCRMPRLFAAAAGGRTALPLSYVQAAAHAHERTAAALRRHFVTHFAQNAPGTRWQTPAPTNAVTSLPNAVLLFVSMRVAGQGGASMSAVGSCLHYEPYPFNRLPFVISTRALSKTKRRVATRARCRLRSHVPAITGKFSAATCQHTSIFHRHLHAVCMQQTVNRQYTGQTRARRPPNSRLYLLPQTGEPSAVWRDVRTWQAFSKKLPATMWCDQVVLATLS